MSIIKNLILVSFLLLNMSLVNAEEIKKVLKNKDWEAYVINNNNLNKIFLTKDMDLDIIFVLH